MYIFNSILKNQKQLKIILYNKIIKNNFHNLNKSNINNKNHFIINKFILSNCQINNYVTNIQNNFIGENLNNYFISQNNSKDKPLTFIDMTYGDGHYTKYLLDNMDNVTVICLDRDIECYKLAKTLSEKDDRVIPLHGKFSDLPNMLNSIGYLFNSINGIIIDCGISNLQYNSNRGFNLNNNNILDLNMDSSSSSNIKGYELLYALEEVVLSKILKIYGEEKYNKKISRNFIESKYTFKNIKTTYELNDFISGVIGTEHRQTLYNENEHVAQKVLNALRRFLNNDLNELNYGMILCEKYIKPNGIVMTTTDSIVEDKIIKKHLTGNIVENQINDMSLKFIHHGLSINSNVIKTLTYSSWKIINKIIYKDEKIKLRVARKKEENNIQAEEIK